MPFLQQLQQSFQNNANPTEATGMQTYMRDMFVYHGIKAPLRKKLQREAYDAHKPEVQANIREITDALFALPQREYNYCAIDLYTRILKKKFVKEDIVQIERMITTESWWDTVDLTAKHILGNYLLLFPSEKEHIISRYSDDDNMWLNRSAILFQLGYKEKTDEQELFKQCLKHRHSEEFFIQKAIGWALREYGKTNPKAVKAFVASTTLAPLSTHEAIRNIK